MPSVDHISDYRQVGTVTRPHGVLGVLKVRPETDDPYRFDSLETLYLGKTGSRLSPLAVESVSYQPFKSGVAVLVQFAGVKGREAAEALAGLEVWAREGDLPPLEDGEVFLSDLVGLSVQAESGDVLGRVSDVIEYPAHPTLSVLRLDGSMALVPFVPELVPEFDVEAGFLVVRDLQGLLQGDAVSERD